MQRKIEKRMRADKGVDKQIYSNESRFIKQQRKTRKFIGTMEKDKLSGRERQRNTVDKAKALQKNRVLL